MAVVTDGTAVLGLGNLGPRRGPAGDGGQGRAVQAVRRDRRVADLPRQHRRRRDRADRRGDLTRLRRDQPGGHLRAALLRDRAPAARPARHPGLPRRPARHGDRGARRADQRAALRGEGARPTSRSWWPGAAPPVRRSSRCCSPPARNTCWCGTGKAFSPRTTTGCRRTSGARRATNPAGRTGGLDDALDGADVFIGVSAADILAGRIPRRMARTRSSSRSPTPTPRSTSTRPARWRRSSRPAAATIRTRSTTCSPSPGVFRGLLDARAHDITT